MPDITPAPVALPDENDSYTDRRLIRAKLAQLEAEQIRHELEDREIHREVREAVQRADRYLSQIRALVAIVAFCGVSVVGGILTLGDWVLDMKIRESIEKVISERRLP